MSKHILDQCAQCKDLRSELFLCDEEDEPSSGEVRYSEPRYESLFSFINLDDVMSGRNVLIYLIFFQYMKILRKMHDW